ncbi:MAG TPA: sigma-70 family RNA polymerase sigma factor [Gaiellales bacterium]|jgi:RNA polymerase sigma-70 factor (ECF subfamily)|nr:sigma-70 family RNA polymerase sigma factor [Gaiellales bacterium]
MAEPPVPPAVLRLPPDERRLIDGLRARDEDAFAELIDRYQASLVRVAMMYVGSRAVAEDVVAETWLGVLRGIDGFQGRSSLRTWIYRILTNTAKTRAQRERRSIPFTAIGDGEDGPAVDPDRFLPPGDPAAGAWASPPRGWDGLPEATLLGAETRSVIDAAIDRLPPTQREVIRLRDVEGFSSAEVRALLELSETNQRVLLHRARSKVRAALEHYLAEDSS